MADEAEIEVSGHGTFVGFNLCGCGKFKHEYGGWYVGHFDAATMRAEGLGMVKRDGRKYSGGFVDGKEHGHWLTRHNSGYMEYIEYHNGLRRRAGVEYRNGTLIFDGQPGEFLELKRGALDAAVCPAFYRAHRRLTPARGLRFAPQAQVTEAVRKIEARPSRKKSMHARTPRARTIRARCGGRAVHCFLALLFLFIPHALTCHSTNSIVFAAQELPVRARVRGQRA